MFDQDFHVQMVNTHMNSCSRSLNISEMPIKSTRSYHLTLLGWLLSKVRENKCW